MLIFGEVDQQELARRELEQEGVHIVISDANGAVIAIDDLISPQRNTFIRQNAFEVSDFGNIKPPSVPKEDLRPPSGHKAFYLGVVDKRRKRR